MAHYIRSAQTEYGPAKLAIYFAASVIVGLLIALAAHFTGRLLDSLKPVQPKTVRYKVPRHRGPSPVELLDAQQPLGVQPDWEAQPAAAPKAEPAPTSSPAEVEENGAG